MPRPDQCHGRSRFFGGCCRKPTVTRDSKPYCWQHDPERLAAIGKAKRAEIAAKDARDEAEFAAKIHRRDRERAAGTANLTDADLERIAALGGILAMLEKLEVDR